MKQINEKFAVPYYNIKTLLRSAIVNNRLTEGQAKFFEDKYNRK